VPNVFCFGFEKACPLVKWYLMELETYNALLLKIPFFFYGVSGPTGHIQHAVVNGLARSL
jgi:hypothetical protein